MKLSARELSSFQKCPRLPLLEAQAREGGRDRWRPKALFDATWRRGLLALSQGRPLREVTLQAREAFLQVARKPGLELGTGDPWTVAQDYAGALETSLLWISQESLPPQKSLPFLQEGSLGWTPSSFQGPPSLLHRWVSCEKADEDTIWREAHSWAVFGDMALSGLPLQLHLLELGSFREGRLHGPWTKCWRHPSLFGVFRFKRTEGRPLEGAWKPFFYSSQSSRNPEKWVELMKKDGLSPLLYVTLPTLPSGAKEEFLREALEEGIRMEESPGDFRLRPKSRGACDFPFPCQFQRECYLSPSSKL